MRLYELTQNYKNLLELIDDETIPQDEVVKALHQVEEGIISKTQEMAKMLKNIDGDINAFKTEENRLKAKRHALENKYEYIKDYIANELKKVCIQKVDGVVSVKFCKSPASVNITDIKLIPSDYLITKPAEPDKKTILQQLKDGGTIPGVELVTDRQYLKIG